METQCEAKKLLSKRAEWQSFGKAEKTGRPRRETFSDEYEIQDGLGSWKEKPTSYRLRSQAKEKASALVPESHESCRLPSEANSH